MNRIKVVQAAIRKRSRCVYLEIGVSRGRTFRRVVATEKLGVDPHFQMPMWARRMAESKAQSTQYLQMTSDAFFEQHDDLLRHKGIDVALIDGLHSYEQALRDIENVLRYLRDDGVIIVHDCNPKSASTGLSATSYADFRSRSHWWQFTWSGDVWKAIVHLRSKRQDIHVAVLDCDFGLGIIRKGSSESPLSFSTEEISAMNYESLASNRTNLLNLKSPDYLRSFFTGPL